MSLAFRTVYDRLFLQNKLPQIDTRLNFALQQRAAVMPRVFKQLNSTNDIEQAIGVTGYLTFRQIDEGGDLTIDRPEQKLPTTFVHRRFGLGTGVSRDLIEDDNKGYLVNQRMDGLAMSELDSQEIQAASVLNNGFGTNGYDGVPLFSASHPLLKVGGNQSNLLTVAADLAYDSVQAAMIQMENMVDDNGMFRRITPDMLIVSPTSRFIANEILKSSDRPDTANRATNTIQYAENGMPTPIIWPFLTSPKAWFLLSKQSGLVWYWRRKGYTDSWADDWSETAYVARRYRCSFGYFDYKGAFGTPAT